MPRANDTQKAVRINFARDLLTQKDLPEAASELAKIFSLSHRQAYRYLDKAQKLRRPVPLREPKIAFTVELSRSLVDRLRAYASSTGLTLSEVASRAVVMFLNRGPRRG